MIHLEDYLEHRLKDIVSLGENKLELLFDNGYKIVVHGVGEPGFMLKKEAPLEEKEKEKKAKQEARKEASAEKAKKTREKSGDSVVPKTTRKKTTTKKK